MAEDRISYDAFIRFLATPLNDGRPFVLETQHALALALQKKPQPPYVGLHVAHRNRSLELCLRQVCQRLTNCRLVPLEDRQRHGHGQDRQSLSTATEAFPARRYADRHIGVPVCAFDVQASSRRVLTREQILNHVWDYDFGGDARVLETYVSYLRKKLDAHGPQLIHTVRGVGYALRAPRTG